MKGRVDLQTTQGFQHHDGNQLVHMLVKLLFHLPPQVFELKMKNQKKNWKPSGKLVKNIYLRNKNIKPKKHHKNTQVPCQSRFIRDPFLKNKIQSTNFKHTQPGAPRDKARIHCLAMSNQTTTSRKVLRRLPAQICGMTVVLPA